MNHDTANAIRDFVRGEPSPTIADFLVQDAAQYDWTRALVEALVGQTLALAPNRATGEIQLLSNDGTSVLHITTNPSGPATLGGLMAEDLRALLSAIRIHEVESYDLVMLPPNMRMADLDHLCKNAGLSTERLRRFTDLWISEK